MRHQPFGGVRTPDPDAVAAFDAEREESSRISLHLRVKLAVRVTHALIARDERVAVAVRRGDAVEAGADGFAEQRDVRSAVYVGSGHRGDALYVRIGRQSWRPCLRARRVFSYTPPQFEKVKRISTAAAGLLPSYRCSARPLVSDAQ